MAARVVGAVVAAALGTACAAASVVPTLGILLTPQRPELAARINPFADGLALANVAAMRQVDIAGQRLRPSPAELAEITRLSKTAFADEPTAALAIRNLALVADQKLDTPRATRLMDLAQRLTRRDAIVLGWQIEAHVARDDIPGALVNYDRAMRTDIGMRGILLPILSGAMGSTPMVDPLSALLTRDPPWQAAFWATAVNYPDALPSLVTLRQRLSPAMRKASPDVDRTLVEQMVKHGQLMLADRYVGFLRAGQRDDGSVLYNADFGAEPWLSPFDWQLVASGDVSAAINPQAKTLSISASGTATGTVARQLVRLRPGRYVLDVVAGSDVGSAGGRLPLDVTLRCAAAPDTAAPLLQSAVVAGASRKVATIPGGCDFAWITIDFARPGDVDGDEIDIRLTRVALRPLR